MDVSAGSGTCLWCFPERSITRHSPTHPERVSLLCVSGYHPHNEDLRNVVVRSRPKMIPFRWPTSPGYIQLITPRMWHNLMPHFDRMMAASAVALIQLQIYGKIFRFTSREYFRGQSNFEFPPCRTCSFKVRWCYSGPHKEFNSNDGEVTRTNYVEKSSVCTWYPHLHTNFPIYEDIIYNWVGLIVVVNGRNELDGVHVAKLHSKHKVSEKEHPRFEYLAHLFCSDISAFTNALLRPVAFSRSVDSHCLVSLNSYANMIFNLSLSTRILRKWVRVITASVDEDDGDLRNYPIRVDLNYFRNRTLKTKDHLDDLADNGDCRWNPVIRK